MRAAYATIDLGAIAHNVEWLRSISAPADVWAVVKANAYGHGAIEVSRVALAAGAPGLCVALVQEGVELRRAGVTAPILVLSEQPARQLRELVDHGLTPTVYSVAGVEALASVASPGYSVHVKVDTGMQRVGCAPEDVAGVLDVLARHGLRLDGLFTHLARADEPVSPATDRQLDLFDGVVAAHGITAVTHAANSAGAIAHPRARRSFVRAGIATYGLAPGPEVADLCVGLRPAMSLTATIGHVKTVRAGSSLSYGHRYTFGVDAQVATVPIGYADGVPRGLSVAGGEVLVNGRRCPIRGVVTMDQLMVEVSDLGVQAGDDVVLIGRQDDEVITADEWATRMDTISYEIVCGISARVPRLYRNLAT